MTQGGDGKKRISEFEQILTATTRAVARKPDLDLTFRARRNSPGSNRPPRGLPQQTTGPVLEAPQLDMDPREIACLRAETDKVALRTRHHDTQMHARYRPSGEAAQKIYETLEDVRLEALGSRDYAGIAQNLERLNAQRLVLNQGDQKSLDATVPEMMEFFARETLCGFELTEGQARQVDGLRDWLQEKTGQSIGQLGANLDDQQAFAVSVREMLSDMGFAEPLTAPPDEHDPDQEEQDGESSDETQDGQTRGEQQSDDSEEQMSELADGESDSSPDGSMEEADGAALDPEGMEDSEQEPGMSGDDQQPGRPGHNRGEFDDSGYQVYTEKFDEIVHAHDLSSPGELARLRVQLDQFLHRFQSLVGRLANRLQRKLLAQQSRSWVFDLEEGLLDTARLARVVVNPTMPLSYKMETETDFRDTVVTLLIDNSGSMRGRPIAVAAMCADILARTLERCGVKVEILGFTTHSWKGGRSREEWLRAGRVPNPGRLNDLRHIIYKAADAPWRRSRKSLGLMLREGLLKENIDGEAVLWAHERLVARPEQRKILMVISDGAPVDDSTLSANPGHYLEKHLRHVIEMIETKSDVQLLAIGIGHDVTRYYRRAVTINDPEQLGGAMLAELSDLFENQSAKDARAGKHRPGKRVAHR